MILFYLIRQKRLNPKKTVIIVSNSLIFEMGVYKNWIRIFLTLLFNMFQILQNPMTYDLEKDILQVLRSGGKSVIFKKILSHVQGFDYSWLSLNDTIEWF